MVLLTLDRFAQGSEEWYNQRRGMVTASVVKQLVTPTLKVAANMDSRSLANKLVAERITGYTEPEYLSNDMVRGMQDEPLARAWYAEHRARAEVYTVGFFVRRSAGIDIGYSPDGVVGKVGLIEVKSRDQKHHLATILADQAPGEFMAQIQTGLLVTGRKWCDFVSWCGGMPPHVIRVTPDPAWRKAILAAVVQFEEAATEMLATYATRTKGVEPVERIEYQQDMVI